MRRLFLILSAGLTISAGVISQPNPPKEFVEITKQEELEIRHLFRELFLDELFGYTLFGDKPMSFCDWFWEDSAPQLDVKMEDFYTKDAQWLYNVCRDVVEPYEPHQLVTERFRRRWLIWKKRCPAADLGKYLFLAKSFGRTTRIVLINKKAFRKTVNKNIDLFRKMVHSKVTADSLLEQMKDEDSRVCDILNGHQALMGILLGFGRHNSLCIVVFLLSLQLLFYDMPCIYNLLHIGVE